MGRKYIFICDGCDKERTAEQDVLPSEWADVRIALEGFRPWIMGSEGRISDRVLCENCQIRAAELAEPKEWPRKEKPRADQCAQ